MYEFIVNMLLRLAVTCVATPTPTAGKFRQVLGPVQYGTERHTLTIMIITAVVFRAYFSFQLLAYVIKLIKIGSENWCINSPLLNIG